MTYSEYKRVYVERRVEFTRRRIAEDGHEIIDKPTFNKITRKFVKNGGIIIRGEEAERHLKSVGAYASYIPGANAAFIRDDATISDVLEEMYHAQQDRVKKFGELIGEITIIKREIDAQKYLLKVAKKYKIPEAETEVTKKNLKYYELKLAGILGEENERKCIQSGR